MGFLSRFKGLISELNISLTDVSEKTNIPRSTLSSYVNRKSNPSVLQLCALADFFGCSIDYLSGRSDDFGNVTVSGEVLSQEEKDLVTCYRALDFDARNVIRIQLKALVESKA